MLATEKNAVLVSANKPSLTEHLQTEISNKDIQQRLKVMFLSEMIYSKLPILGSKEVLAYYCKRLPLKKSARAILVTDSNEIDVIDSWNFLTASITLYVGCNCFSFFGIEGP